jgi:hypothetical protein
MSLDNDENGGLSDLFVPLLTVFCCFLPIGAFLPSLSRRKRLAVFTAWLAVLGIGWALSALQTSSI